MKEFKAPEGHMFLFDHMVCSAIAGPDHLTLDDFKLVTEEEAKALEAQWEAEAQKMMQEREVQM